MSSHSRERVYEMNRSKEMSNFRDSPYSSKSRDMDNPKRSSYSSVDAGDKHRDSYTSKSGRRSFEDHKDSYISSSERRNSLTSKHSRDPYQGGSKDQYLKVDRGRDEFEPRSRGSYSSRGLRDSFGTRGSRGLSSRGSFVSRGGGGGRESFPSRGSFGSSRGGRDSFTRGSYRGGRDSYPSRGGFGFSRGGKDEGGFSSRGSSGSFRGNREPFSSRGRDSYSSRSMRGPSRGFRLGSTRGSKSEHFMAQLDPRERLELTKEIVASVLGNAEAHYDDDSLFHQREFKRPSRGGFRHKELDRQHYKESRSINHHSSYMHSEKLIKRVRSSPSSSTSRFDKERLHFSEKTKLRVRNKLGGSSSGKRLIEDDDDDDNDIHHAGPPVKQQRLMKRRRESESLSGGNFERRNRSYSPQTRTESLSKLSRERDREDVHSGERVKRAISEKKEEAHVDSDSKKLKRKKTEDTHDEDVKEKGKSKHPISLTEKPEEEEDEKYDFEERRQKSRRETSPSGMQVTIRSDGERAVNSEGHVKSRISGKIFVELECPHCPGQKSITFKEYRYHLDSHGHGMKIEKLTYKHSVVLRRIRLQQRNEQRDLEEKWEKEKPEEFETTISRYCKICKLAFKCLPEDSSAKGIAEHNESKLHKIQLRYLFPRCSMCRMSFPSRLVYEYHIASIRHLRMRTMNQENGEEGSAEDTHREEAKRAEKEEIDLTNFITMDSVGEDEDLGSEQEEITGKQEDIDKAEEDAKEGEDEENETLEEDEENLEMDVEDEEAEHEIEETQQDVEDKEICGKEYIFPLEAVYCKLCHKAIRIDTALGDRAIDRHCTSTVHIDNYLYVESEEFRGQHPENFEEEPLVGEEEGAEEEEEEEAGDGGGGAHEETNDPEKPLEGDNEDHLESEGALQIEVMEEHGDDIDLDAVQKDTEQIENEEVKRNGK